MLDTYAKYIIPVAALVVMFILLLKTIRMRGLKLVFLLAEIAFIAFMLWKCHEYLWGSIVGGVAGMVALLGIYAYLHYINHKSDIDPDPPRPPVLIWKPNIKTGISL